MHRCHFPEQFSPSACSAIKGLVSMHFSILQPMLLLCGHTSAKQATQHFPYLVVNHSLDSFWMRSLFRLRSSYRMRSPLTSFVGITVRDCEKVSYGTILFLSAFLYTVTIDIWMFIFSVWLLSWYFPPSKATQWECNHMYRPTLFLCNEYLLNMLLILFDQIRRWTVISPSGYSILWTWT